MAKKKKEKWSAPYKDYKYRSGNEGRHHRGLTHAGCWWSERPVPYSSFRPQPKNDEVKEGEDEGVNRDEDDDAAAYLGL